MGAKTLDKIKVEMTFNRDLTNLVDVMKSVAGAQYHIMERKCTNLTKHKDALEELSKVYDLRNVAHPFVRPKSNKKIIILVTTDFGFLGGLNMKVIQAGLKQQTKGSHFLVIGERGVNYIREYGFSYTPFSGINPDESRFVLAEKVEKEIFRLILKSGYGQVVMIHPHAQSISVQKIHAINLIPCPNFFKFWTGPVLPDELQAKNAILECEAEDVIEMLTGYWLKYRFIEVFESAKLAEFGARMMHLEESFSTLSKMDKKLKLEFFKIRREKIDQSLRESFTSQLILK